jgi:hypothetical protein
MSALDEISRAVKCKRKGFSRVQIQHFEEFDLFNMNEDCLRDRTNGTSFTAYFNYLVHRLAGASKIPCFNAEKVTIEIK